MRRSYLKTMTLFFSSTWSAEMESGLLQEWMAITIHCRVLLTSFAAWQIASWLTLREIRGPVSRFKACKVFYVYHSQEGPTFCTDVLSGLCLQASWALLKSPFVVAVLLLSWKPEASQRTLSKAKASMCWGHWIGFHHVGSTHNLIHEQAHIA